MLNFKYLLLIVQTIFWIYSAVAHTNYCHPDLCPNGTVHIGCASNGNFGSKCRKDAALLPFTDELKEFMLNKLNEYRNKVAGGFERFKPALRMATLQWDPELAKLAELTVKQCKDKHDTCRNTLQFKHAGQTLGHIIFRANEHNDQTLIEHKIKNWFNQYKNATNDDINQFNHRKGQPITSFTQIIQERATHVGCGILRQQISRWSQQFIVCNYARKNIENQPVYSFGAQPGAGCKTGVNPKYTNLCSLNEEYDVNGKMELDLPKHDPISKLNFRIFFSNGHQPKRNQTIFDTMKSLFIRIFKLF